MPDLEAEPFILDADKEDVFSWRDLRNAISKGRSFTVRGYTIGDGEDDARFLGRFAGATFKGRVRFERCTFTVQFDLAEATFEQTLHLLDCTFNKGLRLRDTTVGGRCSLRGSTVHDKARMWLNWRGLTTDGGLRLMGLTAHAPIDLYQARIGGDLRLDGVQILAKGDSAQHVRTNDYLDPVEKHHVAGEMAGVALGLLGATIDHNLMAPPYGPEGDTDSTLPAASDARRKVRVLGRIDLRARVGERVSFMSAVVDAGADETAVLMDGATVGGSIFFGNRTDITGGMDLRAKVGGQIAFLDATVNAGADNTAIDLESATVRGSILFHAGTRITGSVELQANVGGQINFSATTVRVAVGRDAVNLNKADIRKSVFFQNGTYITGSIDLRARIGGQIAFSKATIEARAGCIAVNMAGATVRESIYFRDGTRTVGAVDLRARIGQQLGFVDATVDAGFGNTAVEMEAAVVGGSVFFRKSTHITGVVRMEASVRGNVEFANASVDAGVGRAAIHMAGAIVDGHVGFQMGTHVTGSIDLRATIGGQVGFDNTTVDARDANFAVSMNEATVGGLVYFDNGTTIHGGVALANAKLRGGLCTTPEVRRELFDRPDKPDSIARRPRTCLITGHLWLDHAESAQSVRLHGVSVLGEIRARHLKVAGDLHLCGGAAGEVSDTALEAAHQSITHGHWLTGWRGELCHLPSTGSEFPVIVGGQQLWCKMERAADAATTGFASDALGWHPWDAHTDASDAGATAIDLELARIQGHLWIRGQRVRGGIKASLARVEGDVSLDRSLIEGDLVLRDATIEGAFEAEPSPRQLPSEPAEPAPLVAGEIDARGAKFESVKLLLGEERTPRDRLARVYRFDGATVGTFEARGWIDCDEPKRFSMHRLRFKDLVLDGIKARLFPPRTPRDRLRLEFAAALALSVIFALAWGEWALSSLFVLGFLAVYVAVALWLRHDDKARRRPRPVLDFLDATHFSSAFHIDVERWARARGDDPHADEVFLKRRRRELSDGEGDATGTVNSHTGRDFSRLHVWYRRGVLDFVFGYRVRWQRALHVFVLFWLLNWAVFLPHTAMESTTNAREPDSREQATAPASHEWGPQRAFFMATRLQVPFVELFIEAEWKPADSVMLDRIDDGGFPWLTYENYAAIMRILNLILVPVIIAGATGLLKPREAQYTGAS